MSVEIQIRNNRIFGIALLVIEAILIFIYGFFIHYKKVLKTGNENETPQLLIYDDWFIIATMILLALCGKLMVI
jgi:predicted transcriptional regulator